MIRNILLFFIPIVIPIALVLWALSYLPPDTRTETQRENDRLAFGCVIMKNAADCAVIEAFERYGLDAAKALWAVQRANGSR
jgi:hypothetical protein